MTNSRYEGEGVPQDARHTIRVKTPHTSPFGGSKKTNREMDSDRWSIINRDEYSPVGRRCKYPLKQNLRIRPFCRIKSRRTERDSLSLNNVELAGVCVVTDLRG